MTAPTPQPVRGTAEPRTGYGVRALRVTRSLHRWIGVPLTILVLLSSATGILLAWKKQSATLQPPTREGATTDLRQWRPWHEVQQAAVLALAERLGQPVEELAVDRYDVRPGDGIVKVQFERDQWEVQVDPATLRVRSVARRHSDWIEKLHDLSILSEAVKLVSMNLLGLGLLGLTFSGLWLWYGPRWVRRHRDPSR